MSDTPFGGPGDEDDEFVIEEGLDEDTGGQYYVGEGTYRAKVVEVVKGESKAGNPMWTWTLTVVGGGDKQYHGKELRTWTALTPAAMWKLREVLVALGLAKEGEKGVRFKGSDAIGKECQITVEDGEYGGRKTSNVAKLEAL